MYVFGSGRRGWRGGLVDERIGFGLYQSCRNGEGWTCVCVLVVVVSGWRTWTRVWRGVGGGLGPGSGGVWVADLDQGLEGWCYVSIFCVDGRSRYLCIVLGGYLRI